MIQPIRFLIFAGAALVAPVFLGNCAKADAPASRPVASPTQTPASRTESAPTDSPAIVLADAEKQAVAEFETRVADHATLHQKLEATLPALPDKATPEQIDRHQQALVALITTARKDAKRGDFFTPGMEALVRRSLAALVAGPDGASHRATIMDENPGPLDINVNDPYPDVAPVSSMPVHLLETLPKLPADLEYRFLGRHLVLVCTPARIVLDLTPNVLP
jgi:hypothetical protein